VTHWVAKRLVRVSSIGLPNLILGRPAFPELIQEAVTGKRIWGALEPILDDPSPRLTACDEVLVALSAGLGAGTAAERVARMVEPWLS
jgi:lipid-A-disaccharide synthase